MSGDGKRSIERLVEIMARLRDPDGGCPWDVEQSFETIAPYTIEEAYEVDAAIRAGDMGALRDELGDLLLQVIFHARMAEEAGEFAFGDCVEAICDKMIRRHPHVFGAVDMPDVATQTLAWEAHKANERSARSEGGAPPSQLDGLPLALPALMRAEKLQRRAARVGFDWPDAAPVYGKIEEELGELREALAAQDADAVAAEAGDLLFACVNLARHLKVDAEAALRGANAKFERRFRKVETAVNETGEDLADVGLDRLDQLWNAAKRGET